MAKYIGQCVRSTFCCIKSCEHILVHICIDLHTNLVHNNNSVSAPKGLITLYMEWLDVIRINEHFLCEAHNIQYLLYLF